MTFLSSLVKTARSLVIANFRSRHHRLKSATTKNYRRLKSANYNFSPKVIRQTTLYKLLFTPYTGIESESVSLVAKFKKTINLSNKNELEKTPLGKILNWSMNVGRYIIIFTEFLVIIAFLIRFKLDQDLANLNKQIKQKQEIIASLQEVEYKTESLQQRLAFVERVEAENYSSSEILKEIIKITPIDTIFTDLTIKERVVNINGTALSNVGLNTFLNGLTQNKKFSEISLDTVSSEGEKNPILKFSLSFLYQKTE